MCERKMTWDEVVEKMVEYQEERDHLQAENARLREALEKITYPNLYIDKNQYGATWKSIARKYYEIAEKALKEGNDER